MMYLESVHNVKVRKDESGQIVINLVKVMRNADLQTPIISGFFLS